MSLGFALSFVISFAVAYATTPFVKALAFRIGAIDKPGEARRVHKKPTPLLGGLAIFYGFVVSILCLCRIDLGVRGMIFGALIIIITGIFDDIRPLHPVTKLVGQILAAVVLVLHGVIIERISMPTFIMSEGSLELGLFSIPITIIWVVAVTNAVNLIDGLDGLAAGVSSIASMTLLCIALIASEENIALITAALTGACFGFLPYNFNPAKIFMGDTGAMFLGFILSCVSIMGVFKAYAVISFFVPLIVLGLPLFDTGFVMLRRMKDHKPIMGADRGHLHHKLLDMGLTQKQTVGILYLISSLLGLSAIVLIGGDALRAMVLVAFIIVCITVTYFVITKKKD
ncbi:MAG: undecaprenyl/decaprenyl-phosphate alpha-N-acetylglucosaminyl 1-phosphate transferase [Clostridia bacterium]|nr:undecaprenyl/decaprenyl-phosphate alpha-N-acetylglucosaminyl 1-phosphate transferase [Clostridia bacterium]